MDGVRFVKATVGRMHGMPVRTAARTAITTAAVAATIAVFGVLAHPVVRRGFTVGHDAGAHITYTYLFHRAIGEGQFPVRWVEGVRPGHSQPLFNFYQPGLYYIVELVHLLVPSLAWSLKLAVVGAWALGALFVYLLFERIGRLPALLASSLFACSPYLLLDVFVRAAFPELVAIAVAPGLLWALDRAIVDGGRWQLAAAACLTALALLCHLPTFLVFSPFFAAAIVTGLISPGRRHCALLAVAAFALGAGLSAFYVLPALEELRYTRIAELTSNYFDYHRHFVEPRQWFHYEWGYGPSTEGTHDQMSFQIGVAQLIAMAGGVVALVLAISRKAPAAWRIAGWLLAIATALFLTTPGSVALWDATPQLAYLQFPWRLLMVVTVAAGALGAYALAAVPLRMQAAVVLLAAIGQFALVHSYARPRAYTAPGQMDIDLSGWKFTRSAQEDAFVEPGYFPVAARTLPPRGHKEWEVTSGDATATLDFATAVRIVMTVDARTESVVRLPPHDFPGWRVTVDGKPGPPQREPGLGFLAVTVPAGRHVVEVRFGNTPVRTFANGISVASLFLLTAFTVLSARWRASRRPPSAGR